jgi:ABC-type nitrate/sulfonate/bicarbonate transport system substrate-binding protein
MPLLLEVPPGAAADDSRAVVSHEVSDGSDCASGSNIDAGHRLHLVGGAISGDHGAMDARPLLRPLLALVAILLLIQGVPARAAAAITLGITSATAFSIPHYIAEEKKYYEAEGLSVDTIVAGSAASVLQQLAAGSLNIAQAATDQTLRAILRGAPIRIIAGAASNAPFRVMAAKGTKGWSDLKGRTVSVGGLTDVTLYFLRVMARKNGLSDQDYDLLYGGGTPNRFAQLLSGAVAAAILTNPQDFVALNQGFVDLGSVPEYLPHWAQNNILVDTRWAPQHRAEILAFLRVHIRATRFFYDPANRDEVIGILAKYTKTTREIAASTYDLYVRQQVIAPEAALFADGLKANLDAFVAMGELAEPPPLAGFIDTGYLAEASKP